MKNKIEGRIIMKNMEGILRKQLINPDGEVSKDFIGSSAFRWKTFMLCSIFLGGLILGE